MWPRSEPPASGPIALEIAAASEAPRNADTAAVEPASENDIAPAAAVAADSADELVAEVSPDTTPDTKPAQGEVAAPDQPGIGVNDIVATTPAATIANPSPASSPPSAQAASGKPVMKFDPLDFDPSQLSLGGATASATKESGSVDKTNVEPVVVSNKEEPPAEQLPGVAAVGDPSVTVRVGPGATDAVRSRNVAEHLSLKVESLDLASVPLVQFAAITSEMGNVPVTIDPDALAMAGVSPRATLDVQARGTTLDKLLHAALAKVRLDFVERDGQVVIVNPNRDIRRGVDYDVGDLVEVGAKDATAVSELVQRFVAPESWQGGAGGGTIRVDGTKLHVEHANRVQIPILLFCERVRLARGLALRSRYPAERLSVESPYVKLSAKLSKPTTFTFLPWTRLADVVREWQASTGVTILVDWTALAKEELAPSTPIACSAINRPWDAALDSVLEPLGLAWWAVDAETIQITSHAALAGIERIEFYPAPKRQAKSDDVAVSGASRVERDAVSGRLIVLGSPEVHRQLASQFGQSSPRRQDVHDGARVNATPLGTK
jgi:hypothetical protein